MHGTSLSASKRVVVPEQAGLLAPDRRLPDSFPRRSASVDLVRGFPVTVTGSRRIHTGFPFQLLRATCRRYSDVLAVAGITSPKR